MKLGLYPLLSTVLAAADWDVRIKGGDEADSHVGSYGGEAAFGRLEVYLDSTWGTVCDLGFNKQVANVVCNAVGFRKAAWYSNFYKIRNWFIL